MSLRPPAVLFRVALAAALLGGCTVGPNYRTPDLQSPTAYIEKPPSTAETDVTRWWTTFKDAELDSLIRRGLAQNLDQLESASRIRQSRQQERVASAAGLPQVSATSNALKIKSNNSPFSTLGGGGGGGGAGGGAAAAGIDTAYYTFGFDATWELDVFGGVRRSVEAARANTAAAVWQKRDAEVSLSAEIANDYLTLRALQTRIAIAQGELQTQQGTGQIVKARALFGVVTNLDVSQQNAQIAQTAAGVPQLNAQARAQIHALGVLLGRSPESLSDELSTGRPLPDAPDLPGVGLPSTLLRRRPDVRRADRQLAANVAQIGVNTAALYPTFNLLGLGNFAAPQLSRLFEERSGNAIAAGLVQWNLLTAGRTAANVRASREQANQSYFEYKKAVLGALRDVEDALARYNGDRRRLIALNQQLLSNQSALNIAQAQYVAGLTLFTNVLSSEQGVLNARDQRAQTQEALTQDLVALYKALGGGWSEDDARAIADKGEAPY